MKREASYTFKRYLPFWNQFLYLVGPHLSTVVITVFCLQSVRCQQRTGICRTIYFIFNNVIFNLGEKQFCGGVFNQFLPHILRIIFHFKLKLFRNSTKILQTLETIDRCLSPKTTLSRMVMTFETTNRYIKHCSGWSYLPFWTHRPRTVRNLLLCTLTRNTIFRKLTDSYTSTQKFP